MRRGPIWLIPAIALVVIVLLAATFLLPFVGGVLAFAVSMALAIRGAVRGSRQSAWIAVLLVALIGSIVWLYLQTGWLSFAAFAAVTVTLVVMFFLLLLRWTGERVLSLAVPMMTGAAIFLFVILPPLTGLQIAMRDAAGSANRRPNVDLQWLVTLAGIPVAVVFAIGAFVAGVILLGRWGRKATLRIVG
jgi:hypothetical protein